MVQSIIPTQITDKATLDYLNGNNQNNSSGPQEITDPNIISYLNSNNTPDNYLSKVHQGMGGIAFDTLNSLTNAPISLAESISNIPSQLQGMGDYFNQFPQTKPGTWEHFKQGLIANADFLGNVGMGGAEKVADILNSPSALGKYLNEKGYNNSFTKGLSNLNIPVQSIEQKLGVLPSSPQAQDVRDLGGSLLLASLMKKIPGLTGKSLLMGSASAGSGGNFISGASSIPLSILGGKLGYSVAKPTYELLKNLVNPNKLTEGTNAAQAANEIEQSKLNTARALAPKGTQPIEFGQVALDKQAQNIADMEKAQQLEKSQNIPTTQSQSSQTIPSESSSQGAQTQQETDNTLDQLQSNAQVDKINHELQKSAIKTAAAKVGNESPEKTAVKIENSQNNIDDLNKKIESQPSVNGEENLNELFPNSSSEEIKQQLDNMGDEAQQQKDEVLKNISDESSDLTGTQSGESQLGGYVKLNDKDLMDAFKPEYKKINDEASKVWVDTPQSKNVDMNKIVLGNIKDALGDKYLEDNPDIEEAVGNSKAQLRGDKFISLMRAVNNAHSIAKIKSNDTTLPETERQVWRQRESQLKPISKSYNDTFNNSGKFDSNFKKNFNDVQKRYSEQIMSVRGLPFFKNLMKQGKVPEDFFKSIAGSEKQHIAMQNRVFNNPELLHEALSYEFRKNPEKILDDRSEVKPFVDASNKFSELRDRAKAAQNHIDFVKKLTNIAKKSEPKRKLIEQHAQQTKDLENLKLLHQNHLDEIEKGKISGAKLEKSSKELSDYKKQVQKNATIAKQNKPGLSLDEQIKIAKDKYQKDLDAHLARVKQEGIAKISAQEAADALKKENDFKATKKRLTQKVTRPLSTIAQIALGDRASKDL